MADRPAGGGAPAVARDRAAHLPTVRNGAQRDGSGDADVRRVGLLDGVVECGPPLAGRVGEAERRYPRVRHAVEADGAGRWMPVVPHGHTVTAAAGGWRHAKG